MSLRSAVVSTGVSEAVGSSKITTRWGTVSARAIWASCRWAIDSRSTGTVDRRIDAEDFERLRRAPVHLPVVEPEAPPRFPAEEHVLGDGQIGREHDLLVHEHDSAAFCVDRPLELDRARRRASGRLGSAADAR